MWALMYVPPIEIVSILLEMENNSKVASIDVILAEKVATTLVKGNGNCKNYQNEMNFTSCSKKFFANALEKEKCKIPGM